MLSYKAVNSVFKILHNRRCIHLEVLTQETPCKQYFCYHKMAILTSRLVREDQWIVDLFTAKLPSLVTSLKRKKPSL